MNHADKIEARKERRRVILGTALVYAAAGVIGALAGIGIDAWIHQ
jgi:hypothetical protein